MLIVQNALFSLCCYCAEELCPGVPVTRKHQTLNSEKCLSADEIPSLQPHWAWFLFVLFCCMYCDLGVFLLLYVGMTHSPALHSPHLMVVHKDASSGSGGHPSPGGAGSSFTPVTSIHHHHHHHNTTTVDMETPPRPLSTQTPGMQSHPQASSSPLSNHGNTQGTAPSCPVTSTTCRALPGRITKLTTYVH